MIRGGALWQRGKPSQLHTICKIDPGDMAGTLLPATQRDAILFVDDSQMFASLDAMLAEFADWGRHFYPSPVAFQIGYPADKQWWAGFCDPAKTIGEAILKAVANTQGLYWVDFTALDVFPV